MRLFEKSNYETDFSKNKDVVDYKGYDIYTYDSTGRMRHTFWCSSEDSDYYSSMPTIDDCKMLIDRILENKGN